MARVVSQKLVQVGTGVGLYFSFQIPNGARLLKVDCNNTTEAGTVWFVELSMQKDEVGGMVGGSLLHNEEQTVANKNVSWEASAKWTIGEPMRWVVALASVVASVGAILGVTIIYEVDK